MKLVGLVLLKMWEYLIEGEVNLFQEMILVARGYRLKLVKAHLV